MVESILMLVMKTVAVSSTFELFEQIGMNGYFLSILDMTAK